MLTVSADRSAAIWSLNRPYELGGPSSPAERKGSMKNCSILGLPDIGNDRYPIFDCALREFGNGFSFYFISGEALP